MRALVELSELTSCKHLPADTSVDKVDFFPCFKLKLWTALVQCSVWTDVKGFFQYCMQLKMHFYLLLKDKQQKPFNSLSYFSF